MTRDDAAGPRSVRAFLEAAIEAEVTPGAVALVAHGAELLCLEAAGDAQVVPGREPLTAATPFDLASLTKPLATAALALLLERDLGLSRETAVRALLPELDSADFDGLTLGRLLAHEAGLEAWRPLYLRADTVAGYLREIRAAPLAARPGTKGLYSDLGYIVAGEMLARAAGTPLDALFREVIASPLGLSACFRPSPSMARRAAATEVGQEYERALAGAAAAGYRGYREGVIRGEVHDHHAWIAGGVLGNAGLFADAADLHRLALELLGEGRGVFPPQVLRRMRERGEASEGEVRSQGFALNAGGLGSCGPALEEEAFGHTGFTGTSLWIEPGRRRSYVLLTNRVHPRVRPDDLRAFRREFHRLAAQL